MTDEQRANRTIWGTLCIHMETGTEGPIWAVQDERSVDVERIGHKDGGWASYSGLHYLGIGDHLTIYDPASVKEQNGLLQWYPVVLWEGEIDVDLVGPPVTHFERLPEQIKHDGVTRDDLLRFFNDGYPCRLVKAQDFLVGRMHLAEGSVDGLRHQQVALMFMSDGSLRWHNGPGRIASVDDPPGFRARTYMLRQQKYHQSLRERAKKQ